MADLTVHRSLSDVLSFATLGLLSIGRSRTSCPSSTTTPPGHYSVDLENPSLIINGALNITSIKDGAQL
ncbi:MAG: hypothetical protein QGF62_02770 [Gammaproteobacteria bacterium]|nr:hypothetical protein [Gammaproteobacteria bacterium]